MHPYVEVALFFSFLNAALLLGLLYVYAKILLRTHAKYTFGLILFAGLLLIQNIITLSSYLFMIEFYSMQIYPILDLVSMFEFAALIALFKVTL